MEVKQIGSQFWVVREDSSPRGFSVVDGPYPEASQAISMARLRDM